MLPLKLEVPFAPFGNRGISWLPGLIVVDSRLDPAEKRRVIANETVHQYQWLECGIAGFPVVYLALWLWTMARGGRGYYDHPMEVDSRDWDEDLKNRPRYYWCSLLRQ